MKPNIPKTKVLMFGPALDVRGGIASVERLIMAHLPGHEVAIEQVPTMYDGSPWRKIVTFARAVARLRRADPGREEVVHIHFSARGSTVRKAILCAVAHHQQKPVILHAHGSVYREFFGGLPRPLRALVAATFRRCDRFIALSSNWEDFYRDAFALKPGQLVVLHNPVDLPPTVPDRSGRTELAIAFLGRIGDRKGTFELLEAFAKLPDAIRARTRLHLAGDGEVERATQLAKTLGISDRVQLHAWLSPADRDALLAASDLFVLPSHQEGLPMAMLEAMGWGLPVVVTPVGGIPEVVRQGETGWLVPVGDGEALTDALAQLLTKETQRLALGAAGRQAVASMGMADYAHALQGVYTAARGPEGANP